MAFAFVACGGDVEFFFLVFRAGALVQFVNGGLRAPESPHWQHQVHIAVRARLKRYPVPGGIPCPAVAFGGSMGEWLGARCMGEGPTIKKSNSQRLGQFDSFIVIFLTL